MSSSVTARVAVPVHQSIVPSPNSNSFLANKRRSVVSAASTSSLPHYQSPHPTLHPQIPHDPVMVSSAIDTSSFLHHHAFLHNFSSSDAHTCASHHSIISLISSLPICTVPLSQQQVSRHRLILSSSSVTLVSIHGSSFTVSWSHAISKWLVVTLSFPLHQAHWC